MEDVDQKKKFSLVDLRETRNLFSGSKIGFELSKIASMSPFIRSSQLYESFFPIEQSFHDRPVFPKEKQQPLLIRLLQHC